VVVRVADTARTITGKRSRGRVGCGVRFQTGATAVNKDELKGKWKQVKGKAKEQWGKLTDDELDRIDGDAEQLEGKIQEKYGASKEEAREQVDRFCASC